MAANQPRQWSRERWADARRASPNGTRSSARLSSTAETVSSGIRAWRIYALTSLLTVDDMAAMFHVSTRRVQAIDREKHARWGYGRLVGFRWLFTPEEVEHLRPGPVGRPAATE